MPAAHLDPPRHDSADVRAFLDDSIENLIQAAHAPMLPFDSPEFHNRQYSGFPLHSATDRFIGGQLIVIS
jgi:hypothetical protein